MKINESFPYDAFKFLIQSLRTADTDGVLERFVGAQQTEFERTHARILQLPEIQDIALVDNELLQYVKWIVGWSDERELSFVNDLSDSQLRKLIKLSVPMWKSKGTRQGLVDAIRIFTGKSVGFRSWFESRWILDEAGVWFTGVADDPWTTGGLYTDNDETLSWLFMNRSGLDDSSRRLLYDLTSYIAPLNEHYGLVYCAFFDDFLDGTLGQWQLGGDPIAVTNDLRAVLPAGTAMNVNASVDEMETWGPFQRVEATFFTEDNDATTVLRVRFMVAATGEHYRVKLQADGAMTLHIFRGGSYTAIGSAAVDLPIGATGGGEPFLVSCAVDPINDAQNRLVVSVNGQVEIDQVASFDNCLRSPSGGVQVANLSGGGLLSIDNIVIHATPDHVQMIGQRSLIDQGQVATADPGNEIFIPIPSEPTINPYLLVEYCTAAEWASWTLAGFWQVSPFSSLCAFACPWFGQNGVGALPNHTTDMDYIGAADAAIRSPNLDLSSIDSDVYSVGVEVWYRPNKVSPTPGSDEVVSLQYNVGAGDVTIAAFTNFASSQLSGVEPDADPRIGDGTWWRRQLFAVPEAAFTASTSFSILFDVNGAYTSTDFGFGVTKLAIKVARK